MNLITLPDSMILLRDTRNFSKMIIKGRGGGLLLGVKVQFLLLWMGEAGNFNCDLKDLLLLPG